MEPIIDHIEITVRDMSVAVPFDDKLLPLLGFDLGNKSTARTVLRSERRPAPKSIACMLRLLLQGSGRDKVRDRVDKPMTKVRINSFSISADGYGAGPDQSLENPLGRGGMRLHSWALPTRTFQQALFGKPGGTTGIDDTFAERGLQNIGAWILGRNMFAPSRIR